MAEPADDERISITLTRKQWREIKAALSVWSDAQGVLWDELDTWDLGEGETRG